MLAGLFFAPAQAFNTFDDHVLRGGIVNRQYWVDSSASQFNSAITDGVNAWNTAGAINFAFGPTSSKSASEIEVYYWEGNPNACAEVRHFDFGYQQLPIPPNANWDFAQIIIRPPLTNENACGPVGHRKGILAHEVGHTVGLAHVQNNSNPLMFAGIAATTTNQPQADDRDGINHLY